MASSNNSQSYTLPAGKYWIGDPCYPFPNEGKHSDQWDIILEATSFFDGCNHIKVGEIELWATHTQYGDGLYESDGDYQYPVDSGMLGIIPQSTIDFLNPSTYLYDDVAIDVHKFLENCGTFIEFEKQFLVTFKNGVFRFGYITIDTNEDGNYHDEDDYDQYNPETYY